MRAKGPNKLECMKILRDILHDTKWMHHGLLDIALDPSKRCGSNIKPGVVTSNQIAIEF